MSNEFREWLYTHHINIVDTNKRFARYPKFSTEFFMVEQDYNSIIQHSRYDTEPLYTVEIPKSELERICDFEQQVFGNMRQSGHYNMFEVLMDQKEKEKYLRKKYPAVDLAYTNYSLMLKLAESGEL